MSVPINAVPVPIVQRVHLDSHNPSLPASAYSEGVLLRTSSNYTYYVHEVTLGGTKHIDIVLIYPQLISGQISRFTAQEFLDEHSNLTIDIIHPVTNLTPHHAGQTVEVYQQPQLRLI